MDRPPKATPIPPHSQQTDIVIESLKINSAITGFTSIEVNGCVIDISHMPRDQQSSTLRLLTDHISSRVLVTTAEWQEMGLP